MQRSLWAEHLDRVYTLNVISSQNMTHWKLFLYETYFSSFQRLIWKKFPILIEIEAGWFPRYTSSRELHLHHLHMASLHPFWVLQKDPPALPLPLCHTSSAWIASSTYSSELMRWFRHLELCAITIYHLHLLLNGTIGLTSFVTKWATLQVQRTMSFISPVEM